MKTLIIAALVLSVIDAPALDRVEAGPWGISMSGHMTGARDGQGENALHQLAHFGCSQTMVETAQILFDAGADITAKNKQGKTPLDVLLDNSMRNSDLVKLYRKHAEKAAPKKRR